MSTTSEKLEPLEIKAYRCSVIDPYSKLTCGNVIAQALGESLKAVKARATKQREYSI